VSEIGARTKVTRNVNYKIYSLLIVNRVCAVAIMSRFVNVTGYQSGDRWKTNTYESAD